MADKKDKTTKNNKRWTENELELFAEVLADLENNFAISFEKLALKKIANNEIFEHIKSTFEMTMENEIFKQNNADQVKGNATKLEYKLRQKCEWFSLLYSKISDIESNYSQLK